MKTSLMKWINFRNCYYLLIVNVAVIITGFLLYAVKSIPKTPLQVIGTSVGCAIGIYVYLAFIKYSYMIEQNKFRQLMFAGLCLTLISFLAFIAQTAMNNLKDHYSFIPMALETPLLFYAFNLIENDETIYFKKLSRLNLYTLIAGIPILIGWLVSLSVSYPFVILFPFILAGLVVAILIWYWKIKLFKHLAAKYN